MLRGFFMSYLLLDLLPAAHVYRRSYFFLDKKVSKKSRAVIS